MSESGCFLSFKTASAFSITRFFNTPSSYSPFNFTVLKYQHLGALLSWCRSFCIYHNTKCQFKIFFLASAMLLNISGTFNQNWLLHSKNIFHNQRGYWCLPELPHHHFYNSAVKSFKHPFNLKSSLSISIICLTTLFDNSTGCPPSPGKRHYVICAGTGFQ